MVCARLKEESDDATKCNSSGVNCSELMQFVKSAFPPRLSLLSLLLPCIHGLYLDVTAITEEIYNGFRRLPRAVDHSARVSMKSAANREI